jgi:hypothetical protein
MAFFEIRQYRIVEGGRDAWVKLMEETIIPYQIKKGMVVTGSFTGMDEDDLYVWIRRFDDEAEKDRLYKAVYEDAEWLEVIKPQTDSLILREKIEVLRVQPTSRSVMR